jgi:hypothetical protein
MTRHFHFTAVEERPLCVDMTTPELVTEYVDIKCADARRDGIGPLDEHLRLKVVVDELRTRHVLDVV